jgi:hypothetical protein
MPQIRTNYNKVIKYGNAETLFVLGILWKEVVRKYRH